MGLTSVLKHARPSLFSSPLAGLSFVYGINNISFIYPLNTIIIVNDCFLDARLRTANWMLGLLIQTLGWSPVQGSSGTVWRRRTPSPPRLHRHTKAPWESLPHFSPVIWFPATKEHKLILYRLYDLVQLLLFLLMTIVLFHHSHTVHMWWSYVLHTIRIFIEKK